MKTRLWLIVAALGAVLTRPCWSAPPDIASLRLVPFPKEIQAAEGTFRLDAGLVLEAPSESGAALLEMLNEELQRAGLPPAKLRRTASPGQWFRLAHGSRKLAVPAVPEAGGAPEAYALDLGRRGITASAREKAGLFGALQTLRQLIRANRHGDTLPALAIRDWPALRWRAFQDDMTRGPSSRLETLQFEAALGAYLKFNLMTYYMEYQFAHAKHPAIGPVDGSLTPAELRALVEYARQHQIDVLGNQQSFAHFSRILSLPQYADLRETDDVLSPAIDRTYSLLDDLYSEVCPCVPFPWFNVCCDETAGLGTGPAKALAAEIGVGGVYVRHIRRVHDLLRDKYGKRMMMWGDIILQHPDRLTEVPRDTLLLSWGYDARESFDDQIVLFAKSGFEFFVCPGVNNWSRILPDFGVAVTNIQHFVRDGVRHGALGMINTDWEDDGEALNAVKWHADAWAAECAWNGATTPIAVFNRRVGGVLFGEPGDQFGQAIDLLAQAHRQPAMKGLFNSRFWEDDWLRPGDPAALGLAASNLLGVVRPAIEHLRTCQAQARANPVILQSVLFGAQRLEWIGTRMLDAVAVARLHGEAQRALAGTPPDRSAAAARLQEAESIVQRNREALDGLGRRFAQLWLAESKPYALDWTLARYTNTAARVAACAQRWAAARTGVGEGAPLPTLAELQTPGR